MENETLSSKMESNNKGPRQIFFFFFCLITINDGRTFVPEGAQFGNVMDYKHIRKPFSKVCFHLTFLSRASCV